MTDFIIENGILKEYTGSGVEVVVPEGVTTIATAAFQDHYDMESIHIPPSLKCCEEAAFEGCDNLRRVYITDLSAWLEIDFAGECEMFGIAVERTNPLTRALRQTSEGMQTTDVDLYVNGERLTELVIPEGVTAIKQKTFKGWSALRRVWLPEGVVAIGAQAFWGCGNLEHIHFPASLRRVEDAAFGASYENVDHITVDIADVGVWVQSDFRQSLGGKTATTLLVNGEPATHLVIPEGVTYINAYRMMIYQNIKSVTIPRSVKKIVGHAFSFGKLDIHISDLSAWLEIDFDKAWGTWKFESYTLYLNRAPLTALVVPEGTTEVKKGPFVHCKGLTSVVIPSSLKRCDADAFLGCESLEAVHISDLAAWRCIDFETDREPYTHLLYSGATLYCNGEVVEVMREENKQ